MAESLLWMFANGQVMSRDVGLGKAIGEMPRVVEAGKRMG